MNLPASDARRPLVLAAIMAAMFTIAVEATIVSTAMPQIAGQLGDMHLYSWAFASFLLTQTATTVMFGKLADLYGRKPVLLGGIAVFVLGSLLCGFAWSMPSLIVFRLIQGIGGGAIQPVSFTIVGDLYSPEERGKVQGYLASVWGISSVLGPLAGGLIVAHMSWAWIFWINIPIGLLAAAGFIAFLNERVPRQKHSVDYAGALWFVAAISALMISFTQFGTGDTASAWLALGTFVVSAALFVLQERRAADPMLPFRLWARRAIATANLATVLGSMASVGLTAFLPMYVQGVLGCSPLVAGFALTMMVLGWPIGATLAARNFARFGLRTTMLFGAALLPVGALAFVVLAPGMSPVVAGIGSGVIGFGMGFLSTSALIIIQGSVGWAERGAATASSVFARNIGATLGATVFGGVLNFGLWRMGTGVDIEQLRRLFASSADAAVDNGLRLMLGQALHLTFWAVFAVALLTTLVAMLAPVVTLDRPTERELEGALQAVPVD